MDSLSFRELIATLKHGGDGMAQKAVTTYVRDVFVMGR